MATDNLNLQQVELQNKLKPIEEILSRLEDKDDYLKRSHTSTLLSFKLMLDYMEDTIGSIKQRDICNLLTTFRDMSLRYYIQFETTLLENILEQQTLRTQAEDAIGLIDSGALKNIKEKQLKAKIEKAIRAAKDPLKAAFESASMEEEKLRKDYPALMQKALDKLKDEWQRLNAIAIANKSLSRDNELIKTLYAVVEIARFLVGIKVRQIAVVPGDAFALQFYSYYRDFAVLIVPIYSVQAVWEWSIFWHELAGDKVRRLEKDATAEINSLITFHREYQQSTIEKKEEVLAFVTRNNGSLIGNNHFSQKYLKELFDNPELSLKDVGSFEYQFERMLEELPHTDKISAYEELKKSGWCVDWFKEFFEDTWSVLAIRRPFLIFFDDVLNRHPGTDGRHPPKDIRQKVAEELLNLMETVDQDEKVPEKLEDKAVQSTAKQILHFVSLLMASSMAWLFEDPQSPDYKKKYSRTELSDELGILIGTHIKNWHGGLKASSFEEIEKNAEEFIKTVGSEDVRKFIRSLRISGEESSLSYSDLLMNANGIPKDYKELLELSFYDIDFDVVQDCTIFVHGVSPFTYSGILPDNGGGVIYQARVGKNENDPKVSKSTDARTWNNNPQLSAHKVFPTVM
jgi:hypothetical protein